MISVIMPVYNTDPADLERCMASIFDQSYTDFEVVIVDDGSTDPACLDCLQRLAAAHSEIRLLRQANGGPSAARNAALDAANGDFICFVDSDDLLCPGFFVEAMAAFDETTSAVFGKTEWQSEDCTMIKTNVAVGDAAVTDYTLNSDDERIAFIRAALRWKNGANFQQGQQPEIWCKLFRKSIVQGIRFHTDVLIGEDQLFTTEAVLRSTQIRIVDRLWYRYIIHPNSLMRSLTFRSVDKYLSFFKQFVGIFGEEKNVVVYEKAYYCFRELLEAASGADLSREDHKQALEIIHNFTEDATVKKYLFHIPFRATAVPWYDRILCRIGTFRSLLAFRRRRA